ncbi:gliding motility-associated ABC transporter ATP-binding subunit GldA [Fulvivirga sp. M361]|uniref:gliding motility-associated ABC transporter ATP-binding subunit GldA n=1 Tax=Fulvivirga sp. M361 TaxID=2594266 RepID=UPI00117A0FBC|nr:gliding motility-associated ABC transporter ATP-binding subunit GldA [Fulvivirga sp. M361]TRX52006.1 gliding motility-associated ABC transporter ATP-binding subunit GldA [Fulvivirga sp. M361]
MSIQVSNLTKKFGQQKALDNVSFNVDEGEILGFLGPNGAGKSTTMKIMTCFLPPTEGQVRICGKDVVTDPQHVRKMIGYLPEHNPLYLDMYVREALRFAGKAHKVKGKKLNDRVEEVITLCGLRREQNKKIEALSKGYRQRLGLAQALIHDPKVLILDEPTTGLDPNQIIEIRALIKETSKNKTVIFSSHVMQEIQALCNRVVVINHGRLVADDPIEQLKIQQVKRMVIKLEFSEPVDVSLLQAIEGVEKVITQEAGKYIVETSSERDIRPAIFQCAKEYQLTLLGIQQEETTMEAVFQELTQSDNTL